MNGMSPRGDREDNFEGCEDFKAREDFEAREELVEDDA
jgi:hypothetical protein